MTVHEKLCGILRSDIIKGVGVLIQGGKYVWLFGKLAKKSSIRALMPFYEYYLLSYTWHTPRFDKNQYSFKSNCH